MAFEIQRALDLWFLEKKRSFPWRENPSPYRVLVSEVMLQQTQVSRVLLYFSKWMEQFPTLEALAHAPEEVVLKAWEGLGYYRRARALQTAARIILSQYKGSIPQEKELLLRIPGIGPYTAGAILSFAFHKRALAVDANVERVIRRIYGISYEAAQEKKQIERAVENLLPKKNAWHTMEGLIELGALVCQKKPACETCPVSQFCHAYLHNFFEEPPPKSPITHLHRDVACITAQESVLVVQRKDKELMSGLYEFPYFDSFQGGRSGQDFLRYLQEHKNLYLSLGKKLPKVVHSFTRFRSYLYPMLFYSQKKFPFIGGRWIPLTKLSSLPFSSGHKRILSQIQAFSRLLQKPLSL